MYVAAIVIYLFGLAALWWRYGWRARSADEHLVAGRSLPASVLILTLTAAWIGPGSLFAGAGLGYRTGFAALWQPAGAWAGIAVAYFLAARVRRLGGYTVSDLLELRYGAAARVLATVVMVLAYLTLTAFQFRASGRLLTLVAHVNPAWGALLIGVFCIGVTAFGGMRSIAYLDVVNGATIGLGLVLAVVYLLGRGGGFGAVRPDQLTLFGSMSPLDALGLFLPTTVLLLGEASLYQKLSSARDERTGRRAVAGWLAATIAVEVLLAAVAVLGSGAQPGLDPEQSEAIVVRLAVGSLPLVVGMLLLASAAAIVVSTADTFLLVTSTTILRHLYRPLVDPGAPDARVQQWFRGITVAVGVVALIGATTFPALLPAGLWAYTVYAAAVVPALVAALAWQGVSREAGVASIAMGIVVTLIWQIAAVFHGRSPAGLQTIYVGLAASIATLLAVSMTSSRPGSEQASA